MAAPQGGGEAGGATWRQRATLPAVELEGRSPGLSGAPRRLGTGPPVLVPPARNYFGVAQVERDQAEDYARRKGMALAESRLACPDPLLHPVAILTRIVQKGFASRRTATL